jgi:tRNA G18 (ribose-2'-O)-methylase SpoU
LWALQIAKRQILAMKTLNGTGLKRFLRDWRRVHRPGGALALVLQSVAYPVNVGSLFRIADAVSIDVMMLCGITPVPPNATITKVGRDKHNNVNWSYVEKVEDAVTQLKREAYHIAALEITDTAIPYFDMEVPDRVCLVVGNEDHGITQSTLEMCDSALFVPMYGQGHSLNVHVSAAVVLYHLRWALMLEP